MEEVGRLRGAGLQLPIADRDGCAVRVAVDDVADGDLVRIERAATRDPVVQVPGEDTLVERHALEGLDILQRAQRRVGHLHERPLPGASGHACHTPRSVRFPPRGDAPIDCPLVSIRRGFITMLVGQYKSARVRGGGNAMKSIVSIAAGCAALVLASAAHAQNAPSAPPYPTRQVRIIVPYPAGGPTDVLAR